MTYLPIENYGIIGDMHSAALVGINASIDWFCFPRFDSPSVFAAILDDEKGGRFDVSPAIEGVKSKQVYWPDTNVLVTRFLSPAGIAEVIDYMPVGEAAQRFGEHQLVRRIKVVHGEMPLRLICHPAFNYARDPHETTITSGGACFHSALLSLGLASHIPLEQDGKGVKADFTLREGEAASFVLRQIEPDSGCGRVLSEEEIDVQFRLTVDFWQHWIAGCTYAGRWREVVYRSALALKLMTYEPTGAIVAAPTCSLPEMIGGARNWDYRYTWIRDAAFTLYGLLRIGFKEEATHFMNWLDMISHDPSSEKMLQIIYGLDGRPDLPEETLDHLEGYRGSRPVRIGNNAYNQLQLDIYGELMDSVYLYNKHVTPISYDTWSRLRRLVNWVSENWRLEDDGIWEVRGGRKQFVYSKVMCWVALDRAIRLADKRSLPADHEMWLKVRDEIYEDVMQNGWNPQVGAFTLFYGSNSLDAANLIMPLVFFMSPTDPRMLSTLRAIYQPPSRGGLMADSLIYRYNLREFTDGLRGDEGTFNICTFWLVEAMTRAGRSNRAWLDQARLVFEKMHSYANHVGLYAEQTGQSGEMLGNFPQAFTHLSLISAAFNLDRALGTSD
jgi:GH15 family glucan-1,4-alpha-glucosidase